jgi:hypothetical protein
LRNFQRLTIASLFALVAVGVFIAASAAFAPSSGFTAGPPLGSDLPYQALTPVVLTASDRATIEKVVIPPLADRYGITASSYATVRKLADTSLGPLFIVSGATGVCVVLGQSMACGNPDTADKRVVAVFDADSVGHYVGGGVVASGVGTVTVGDARGASAKATPVQGGFTIASSSDLAVSGPITLSTN